jgi:hypothetical protein
MVVPSSGPAETGPLLGGQTMVPALVWIICLVIWRLSGRYKKAIAAATS